MVTNRDGGDFGTNRDDGPRRLVSGDQREDCALELTVEDVRIGAADTNGGDLDHNVLGAWGWVRNFTKGQLARGLEHNCSHLL